MKNLYFELNLQLFALTDYTQNQTKSTTPAMEPTMKEFYDTSLLMNARDNMVFYQFAKKQSMSHGKTVEWRRFNTFDEALTPLTEGVVPPGSTFGMESIKASLTQHGDYTTYTDVLKLTSFDDVIFGATEEMGAAMGKTRDLLTRNVICTGGSVAYPMKSDGKTPVTDEDDLDGSYRLTAYDVNRAVTWLKKNNAPKIDGSYIAFIHPSVAEDLRESDGWKEAHQYASVKEIFNGEIGELHGCRFIETNAAKIYKKGNAAIYETVFFGKDAYGAAELEGAGPEMVIHTPDEVGGPLDQFGTIGYKFMFGAAILYPERLVRMKTNSSYSLIDEVN